MSQATFVNRRALHLRPDPARVIVRPFKPATEPRDLKPTAKTRANHIVERVLRMDSKEAARQLADVLENFEGRHRKLLETFAQRDLSRYVNPFIGTCWRRLSGGPMKWKRR